jgi:class 3 adenylate cyclase
VNSGEIITQVKAILKASWQLDPARTVPELERVKLAGNHGVEIDAAVLYADMADSTKLVDGFKATFAGEIYKSFVYGVCKVIGSESGEVTAFDGDRVMGVFMGATKNSDAARCALKINYLVRQINTAISAQYPNTSYSLSHTIGIDTSRLLVAKTGVRDYNDLVWVGPSANYAAKMATINDPGFPTFISEATYNALHTSVKFSGGTPKVDIWERRSWQATGKTVYRSSYWWQF